MDYTDFELYQELISKGEKKMGEVHPNDTQVENHFRTNTGRQAVMQKIDKETVKAEVVWKTDEFELKEKIFSFVLKNGNPSWSLLKAKEKAENILNILQG